jgi:hypothetical protein
MNIDDPDFQQYLAKFKEASPRFETALALARLREESPLPLHELQMNLGLFLSGDVLARILFMHELYQRILPVHGAIVEFGVRWGQNLALFEMFRDIYETHNVTRKIIGFDTFEGFPSVHKEDGTSEQAFVGNYPVTAEYEKFLAKILAFHQSNSLRLNPFELVKGNASETFEQYLETHPETVIALAYFDFDLYEPTKRCLELLQDRVTKGSVIGFDELSAEVFPGETVAVREALGLSAYSIQQLAVYPRASFVVIE